MLMMGIKDGSDLLGSMNMKFDTREDTFAPTKKCLLTEEKLEQLIDDDDYDDCYLHTAIRTSDPKATNILIYERVTTSTTKRSVLYQTEEVLVMAFDANGEATWQQALRKASPSLDVPPALMTVSASITDNRNLRLLYRNGSEIAVEEFKLADGSPVAGSHKVLMEMGAAAFHLGDFTTWLDDETMIILTRQGVFSKDWSLARFDIK
jgi:hypothetical protein